MQTEVKPTFNVRPAVTTIEVDGVVYNAQPIAGNWHQVRDGDYTEGFRQGIMRAQESAGKIVKVARNKWVTGNTALYGGNSGNEWVFAQDLPEVKEGRIVMNQDELVARIEAEGKRIVNDYLHISADGQVRAMKRKGFRSGEYTIEQMLASNQPTLITGDEQAPRKIADMMEIAKKPGYLSIPSQGIITVPDLDGGGGRVYLLGGNWGEFNGNGRSFGVRR